MRLVPHPVMMGFVNGLAIVILIGQFGFFKTPLMEEGAAVFENGQKVMTWMSQSKMMTMGGLALLTMAIIQFLPKLTNAVPSILVAILVVGGISYSGLIETKTISDVLFEGWGSRELADSLPVLSLPTDIPWHKEGVAILIIGTAFSAAMVGIIESLMTLQLIDDMTETRGSGNRECLAQGGANLLSGLFGGMGGCAMIGQSLINIKSGGRGRWSGIVAALTLAIFILIGGPLIVNIPVAALVGVMFMVVIGTFEWSTLKTFGRVPLSEIFVIVAVTLITVFMHNLALAVLTGVILSALVFAWESAKHVRLRRYDTPDGARIYNLQGVLYLSSMMRSTTRLGCFMPPVHSKHGGSAPLSSPKTSTPILPRPWRKRAPTLTPSSTAGVATCAPARWPSSSVQSAGVPAFSMAATKHGESGFSPIWETLFHPRNPN
ncbi:SulP family inorganic anion transporter [Akkermansiaceae bacterium]|nr:SulP family inorganic anion transporter [Akkermansiaceae bacterium]